MFSQIRNLILSANPGVSVYPDEVPEGEDTPAISFVNIGYVDDRMLSGAKSGHVQSWRITIVAGRLSKLKPIINSLESLDNTKNSDFSKIYVTLSSIEAKDFDAIHRRAFIDLTTYK